MEVKITFIDYSIQMDDDANSLLGRNKGWPHPLDRSECLIEVKITLTDYPIQMDDDANRLLELSKGWPLPLIEVTA